MKKRQSTEAALGVRLVKPHSATCRYSRGKPASTLSTFYMTSDKVYRNRAGVESAGGRFEWRRFVCMLSSDCEAEALLRCDKIEEILQNTITHMQYLKRVDMQRRVPRNASPILKQVMQLRPRYF